MPNPSARGQDLFREMILAFRRQPDPTAGLTLRQIANLALGLGNEKNAAIVGRTVHEFSRYFRQQGTYKICVNWRFVEEEHPELITVRKASQPARSPISEMLQALEDEHRSVQEEIRQRPIQAAIVKEVARLPPNSFIYEAEVMLTGDAEMPIPEGVTMKLEWRAPFLHLRGTLLAYDSTTSRVIFEVDREIPRSHQAANFLLLPSVDELVIAVRDRLRVIADARDSLAHRLLSGDVHRLSVDSSCSKGDLDSSQVESMGRCLRQKVTFLWGPPGTGKTHTLAHLMSHMALSKRRVVAVAIANVAVDQMASRVVSTLKSLGNDGNALLDNGRVLRFGYARLREVTGESRLFPSRTEIQRLRKALHEAQVVLSRIRHDQTEARALQQKVIKDLQQALREVTKKTIQSASIVLTTALQTCIEPAFELGSADVVVIDEASMMPVPFAMCAAGLARTQVVVTGDFRQLGPIALSKTEFGLKWLHRDTFACAGIEGCSPAHPALTMLYNQRRMHADIRDMVNRDFYGGRLAGEGPTAKVRCAALAPLPGEATVLVKATGADGSRVQTTEGRSRFNEYTAMLTARLALTMASRNAAVDLGVITPYRSQVAAIKRLIKDAHVSEEIFQRIRVGTVHAFQGSEADVIIWDLVDTVEHRIGRLYQGDAGDRLANVAISRAQGKLVIVGDPDAFFHARGNEMVRALKNILFRRFVNNRATIPAAEAFAWCDM